MKIVLGFKLSSFLGQKEMLKQIYNVSDVEIDVFCDTHELYSRLMGFMDTSFYLNGNGSKTISSRVSISFVDQSIPILIPKGSKTICKGKNMEVKECGDHRYLISGKSIFRINRKQGQGFASLNSDFWEQCPEERENFFIASLLMLLHYQGIYGLHANALLRNNVGILLVGNQQEGQNTMLSLALINRGCEYVSNEMLLLKRQDDSIIALALHKSVSFDSKLENIFPELKKGREVIHHIAGKKNIQCMNKVYPTQFIPELTPQILIFPDNISHAHSQIIPLDKKAALSLLISNSGGVLFEKGIALEQLGILTSLLSQTRCYKLYVGKDLFCYPLQITDFIDPILY